ncbi:MAG: FAD-dependent oxidoreductase [Actinobacteria bacterium]|nr:FAD-dependent oxidoreductase [Actinomycetota bacterium]
MILTLKEKIVRSSDCTSFCFMPANDITWQAGQYMQFMLPHQNPDERGFNRFFTISSAPHEGFVMITTRFAFDKSSTFKKALFSLEKGSSISAMPPMGEFVVKDYAGDYVFIAGGIGITPFRSIVLDLEHKKALGNCSIYLLYANRDQDIVFKEELDSLAVNFGKFKVRYVISPERCDISLIKIAVPGYREKTYYISGPPGLVKSIEQDLVADGFGQTALNLDYFPGY